MADSKTPQEPTAPVEPATDAVQDGPGAMLRAARESSGQTGTDIARSLCLELRLVEAIENDRYEAFGAAVFARGHVRRYALALELDSEDVLRAWDKRYATAPPPAVPDKRERPVAEHSGGVPALLIVVLLAVLAAGAAFVWWWLHPPAPTSEPVAASPAAPTAAPVTIDTRRSSNTPSPTAAADALGAALEDTASAIEAAAREATLSAGGASDALSGQTGPVTAPQSTSLVAVSAQELSAPGGEVQAPVEEAAPGDVQQAIADAGPAPPVAGGDEMALRFIFDDACWVSVRDASGRTLMLGLREPGTVNDRTGVPPINVTLGRYPGVRIEVEGQPFEVPASAIDGAIARFEIPAP